jgi:pentalenic acid synthase
MTETDTRPTAVEAPAYPMQRKCPYQPPVGYDVLRERGPLTRVTLWDGRQAWVVGGSAEGRALLPDHRLSVDVRNPDFPLLAPRIQAQKAQATPLVGEDDPQHARQRRMLIPGFGVRRMDALRPQIQELADRLLDKMVEKGSPSELVFDFALPLPSMVICLLLGVPYADHDFFAARARHVLSSSGPDEARTAFLDILGYLRKLIDDKIETPGDGLLDELIETRVSKGDATADELAMWSTVLLVSGHETTSNMIALSTLTLLEHPDQLQALRDDPSLMPGAVEELLRYTSIGDTLMRVAVEDIEIAGREIKTGDGVIMSTMLMNRDENAFEDPDRFDVTRAARRHVAFGFGIHQCIGQNLARVEMEIALQRLFDRFPTLRLDVPSEDVPVKPAFILQGIDALPIAW